MKRSTEEIFEQFVTSLGGERGQDFGISVWQGRHNWEHLPTDEVKNYLAKCVRNFISRWEAKQARRQDDAVSLADIKCLPCIIEPDIEAPKFDLQNGKLVEGLMVYGMLLRGDDYRGAAKRLGIGHVTAFYRAELVKARIKHLSAKIAAQYIKAVLPEAIKRYRGAIKPHTLRKVKITQKSMEAYLL